MSAKRTFGKKKKMTVTLAKKDDVLTTSTSEASKKITILKKNGTQQELKSSVSHMARTHQPDFVVLPRFAPQASLSVVQLNETTTDIFDTEDDEDDELDNGFDDPKHVRVVVAAESHSSNFDLSTEELSNQATGTNSSKSKRMSEEVLQLKRITTEDVNSYSLPTTRTKRPRLNDKKDSSFLQSNERVQQQQQQEQEQEEHLIEQQPTSATNALLDDNEDELQMSDDDESSKESSVLFECLRRPKDRTIISKPQHMSVEKKKHEEANTMNVVGGHKTKSTATEASRNNVNFQTVFAAMTKDVSRTRLPESPVMGVTAMELASKNSKTLFNEQVSWTVLIVNTILSKEQTLKTKSMLENDFGFDVFDYAETTQMFSESANTLLSASDDDYKQPSLLIGLTNEFECLFSRYVLLVKFWHWFAHLKYGGQASSSLSTKRRLAILNPTLRAKASVTTLERRGAHVISSVSPQAIQDQFKLWNEATFADYPVPRHTVWRSNHSSDLDETTRFEMVTSQASVRSLQETVVPRFGWSPINKKRVAILLGNPQDAETFNRDGWSLYNDQYLYETIAKTLLSVVCASGDCCSTCHDNNENDDENDDNENTRDLNHKKRELAISIAMLKNRFTQRIQRTCHRIVRSHMVIRRFRNWCNDSKANNNQIMICGFDPVYHAPDIKRLQSCGAYVIAKQHSLTDVSVNVDATYTDANDLATVLSRLVWKGKDFSFLTSKSK